MFIAEDIDATCDKLTANGVTMSQPLTEMAWGKFAAFVDTEGNEFGLRA